MTPDREKENLIAEWRELKKRLEEFEGMDWEKEIFLQFRLEEIDARLCLMGINVEDLED